MLAINGRITEGSEACRCRIRHRACVSEEGWQPWRCLPVLREQQERCCIWDRSFLACPGFAGKLCNLLVYPLVGAATSCLQCQVLIGVVFCFFFFLLLSLYEPYLHCAGKEGRWVETAFCKHIQLSQSSCGKCAESITAQPEKLHPFVRVSPLGK